MGYRDIIVFPLTGSSEISGISGENYIEGFTANHVLINDTIPGCDNDVVWETGNNYVSIGVTGYVGHLIPKPSVFYFGIPE